MNDVAKRLWAAASTLEKSGWTQGTFVDNDGRVCILGACGYRLFGVAVPVSVETALSKTLLSFDQSTYGVVGQWNDRVCADALEAHALLCAAAMEAESFNG